MGLSNEANCHRYLGEESDKQGDTEGAAREYRAAELAYCRRHRRCAVTGEASAGKLRHREWLSLFWGNLGELHAARSDMDKPSKRVAAGKALQNALRIARELNREKRNATFVQNCLATACLNHGDYLLKSELRPADAVAELDQARILYDRLYDRHPDEVDYRWGQALARGSLGMAYLQMKSTGPARIELEQAAGHYDLLVADHPQVLQFAAERREVYDGLARLDLDSGPAGAAARQIIRAIRVRIEVIAAIARSELGRQEKLPALKQRIRELARDSALWVKQLCWLVVTNK